MNISNNLNSNFEYKLFDENQQDAEIRNKLADLYATPFADVLYWELYDPSLIEGGYHKLFYYEQEVLKHIIPFKYSSRSKNKIFVINKEFNICMENIENICRILFYEFAKVQQIIFEKIFVSDPKEAQGIIIEKISDDIILLNLPKTMDDYMKSLGKSSRKHINLKMNRMSRDFPNLKIHYLEKSDILFEHIQEVVFLNRDRMKTKGIVSLLNDTECSIIHRYASKSNFGFLCFCEIDDKIIAATINSVIGENAYMHVIAHDNLYEKYSAGQIALINATKYLIDEFILLHCI